jgi:hypothetical protein
MRLGWFALVLFGGCEAAPPTYTGFNMDDFFPFDGERTWEYVNDDPTIAYHVKAALDSEPQVLEGNAQRAYTINYTIECFAADPSCVEGDPFRVRALTISSDLSFGTMIHSVDMTETGIEAFDPTVALTGPKGKVTDVWETDSGGVSWVSTFTMLTDCEVPYTDEWTNCITLDVDDDGDSATPPSAHPLHGTWIAVPGYNVVAFQWRDDPMPWRLLNQSYAAPE